MARDKRGASGALEVWTKGGPHVCPGCGKAWLADLRLLNPEGARFDGLCPGCGLEGVRSTPLYEVMVGLRVGP